MSLTPDRITLDGLPAKYYENLDSEKVALALALALPRAFRPPMNELAKGLGVTPTTLSAWKHDPYVIDLTRELIRKHYFEDIPDVLEAMKMRAIAGDPQCAKLFLEYVDQWYPRSNITNNFNGPTNVVFTKEETKAHLEQMRRKTQKPIEGEVVNPKPHALQPPAAG